ncbi:MAG: NUDIX domain-containing protein, partial [Candidatus Saccharimonas sp.]
MAERLPAPLERPLHPWHARLDNLAEGKGNFYHWGPNYTVDLVVITSGDMPAILLIQRADTGDWALPGGFIDQGETPIEASLRELQEETGLVLYVEDVSEFIY